MKTFGRWAAAALAMTCAWDAGESAWCDRPATKITPHEVWSTFFCNQQVKLHFDVHSDQKIAGRLLWTHAVEHRTLSRGETAVSVVPAEPVEAEISLGLPEVRSGVVMDTQLRLQLTDHRGDVLAEFDHTIRLFPADPFADRRQWLRELDLVLFDPNRTTEKVFDDSKIPYRPIRAVSGLSLESGACLLVGEDTSLQDYRGLYGEAEELAAAGATVIFLAPADGSFPFPGSDEGQPKPQRVTLRQQDVIRELDKRLDGEAWPPDGKMVKTSLQVLSTRRGAELSVKSSSDHWPWMQVIYPSGGRLLVCGFGIIESWDTGPTPRWLLLRILEQRKVKKSAKSHSNKE